MKPAGLKTTEPRNSTDYRSGLSLSIASTNSDQLLWVSVAFGVIWKKEETLELILEENGSEDPKKLQILNRQLSMESGRLPRICGINQKPRGLAPPSASGLTFHLRVQPAGSSHDPLFHLSHIFGEGQ